MERPPRADAGAEPFVLVCDSHGDTKAVLPEVAWLREHGVGVWCDEEIAAGKVGRTEIAQAIQNASQFIYYISAASLASEHCMREVHDALNQGVDVVRTA